MTITEVYEQKKVGRSTYYRRIRVVSTKILKERHTEDSDMCERMVMFGEITVAEVCKKMNIGVTTYYIIRKDMEFSGKE